MTSLLVLSHSRKVAEAVEDLVRELANEVSVFSVGGAKDGSAGADYDGMKEKLDKALELGEVIVLFDLGSTMMTIQTVVEELSDADRTRVFLSNAALVEGAIAASVGLSADLSAEDILAELEELSLHKM